MNPEKYDAQLEKVSQKADIFVVKYLYLIKEKFFEVNYYNLNYIMVSVIIYEEVC